MRWNFRLYSEAEVLAAAAIRDATCGSDMRNILHPDGVSAAGQ